MTNRVITVWYRCGACQGGGGGQKGGSSSLQQLGPIAAVLPRPAGVWQARALLPRRV